MSRPHSITRSERPGVATAPPEVQQLLTLTLVSAVVHLFLRIIGLFAGATADTAADHLGRSLPAREAAAVADQAAGTAVTTGVVGLALTMAVHVLLYVFLAQGRNWARVLGTVLAGASTVAAVLGLLGALGQGAPAQGGLAQVSLVGVLVLLGALLAVVNVRWLVTAGQGPVRNWFAGRRTA